jgi:YhfZ C-terminal domain/Helix-turn-helix domain
MWCYLDMMENFYSKSGLTLKKIAEELLFYDLDERIPKISDLAEKFEVGRGTIQTGLKILEENNCIKLESRGHLGTFLRKKDVASLLKYSGVDRVLAVMPLPYSRKYEGLATGLTSEFERLNLSLNIAFMRGAKLRLEGVKEGRYDFALVSKSSALEEMENDHDLMIALSFGKQTYVSKHAVIFSNPTKKQIEDGMKIGIDTYSTDQKILTYAETEGKDIDYIQLNYMHLLQHLKANTIDAAIWNVDEIDTTLYHVEPLTSKKAIQHEEEISEAVCVIRKDNRKIEYILNYLSKEKIVEIQKDVERGNIMPKY